jgi:hypothetical protein
MRLTEVCEVLDIDAFMCFKHGRWQARLQTPNILLGEITGPAVRIRVEPERMRDESGCSWDSIVLIEETIPEDDAETSEVISAVRLTMPDV